MAPPKRRLSGAITFVLMAIVDALGVFLVVAFVTSDQPVVALVAGLVLIAVNVIYFRRGVLAAKYLTPGLLFLAIFQLFVIAYTVFISFTNYGAGHNIDKPAAIESILANSVERIADSPAYPVTIAERDGRLYLLVTDDGGDALIGSADSPLALAPSAEFDATGRAVSAEGYATLTTAQILQRQSDVSTLTVPFSDDPDDGFLRTADARTAYVFRSPLSYSTADDTMTDSRTKVQYTDNGDGSFESPDGAELTPGWRAFVGFENFVRAIGSGGQFEILGVFAWTVSFAVLSVVLSFAVGMFMAIVLNAPDLRGRRVYRALMILPYAFPVFLSGLIWSGLLNQKFGFFNEVLFGGASIPWLQDPWLAKLSVVMVSVWFGFPYFFLVCTGALQSIPHEVTEAATVDGANAWQTFRRIKLPLLLVATSPLLIAGFAFSFNDFNTIFMLTGGGPGNPTSQLNAGATDILITVVYKQAFLPNSADYGLASAFAVIIFLVVTGISVALFRRTRSLEEVY